MQRLAALCVRRPVLAQVIALAMVVLGVAAFFHLNLARYPNVELPIITVVTEFPGAGPEQVETDVTRRIEDAVSGIDGIDTVTSTSARGFSIIVAQFVLQKDANVAAQEVRDRVGAITDLPPGIAPSRVLPFDPNQIPVAVIALSGPRETAAAGRPVTPDLTAYADQVVRPQVAGVLGVAQVDIIGDEPRQVNVRIDPARLAALGITATQVIGAVQGASGSAGAGAQTFLVHTYTRLGDLAATPIGRGAGRALQLGDVARITLGAGRPSTLANVNGAPAVLLAVRKQAGANTVQVVRRIRDRLGALTPALPAGDAARIVWDQAEYVTAAGATVERHLLVGTLLAALVVLVFLYDWRATVIAGLAIPISLVSTFALLAALGLTLNTFTLLALALAIGIVIDDAIVVLESIYRHVRERGAPPVRAAIDGTREVGPAVMATTVSLIVVFLPLAFMPGIVGRFMSSFGWTMAFAIAVSLVVSFTLTPSLASRWLRRGDAGGGAGPGAPGAAPRAEPAMDRAYRWLLQWALRRRAVMVALSMITLAGIVPLWRTVGQDFLPTDDESQFEVTAHLGGHPALEETARIATEMAGEIRRFPGVAFTTVSAGDDTQRDPGAFTVLVRMAPLRDRAVTQQQIMARVRTEVLPHYGSQDVEGVVNNVFDLSGSAAPLEYAVSGPDLAVLARTASDAVAYLRTLPGVVDVRSTLTTGRSDAVTVSVARAQNRGVQPDDVAGTLALLGPGVDVRQVEYDDGGRFYGIHLEEGAPDVRDPLVLAAVPLASSSGRTVPLGSLVDLRSTSGPPVIYHRNRERVVTIRANLLPGTSLGDVLARLDARMAALHLDPAYHRAATGVSGQVRETEAAFTQVFAIAFVLMFLVLAAQFESWLHPFTILVSLPLTVPFALLSVLWLHGSLNPLSYLGILVLFGVVKKNAILQVDRANRLRADGMDARAAIVEASLGRLRPILMTTIAFVAGMLPLVVSRGVGAATNQTISTVIVGGQLLSLLLTLIAVPVFYTLLDDLERAGGMRRAPAARRSRVAS
jgi:HAE1 family hydrophobic/amphiphilic exporter-1